MTILSTGKLSGRLVALGILILAVVFGFRAYGVFVSVIMCWILFRFTAFFNCVPMASGRFWVYGYMIVTGATFVLFAPFREFLLNQPALPLMADLGYQKLPIDRVILVLTTQPGAYGDISQELQRPRWYSDIYQHFYPAIFVATYVSLAWFSIALPMVCAKAPATAEQNDERCSPPPTYLRSGVALVALLIACVFMSVDTLFLPGWFRSTTLGPLVNPFLPIFLILAITAWAVDPDHWRGRN